MLFHDELGAFHLFSAFIAVLLGTIILTIKKGTKTHKLIGYGYVVSMLALNITALLIYRLFGGFGIFHIAALVSLGTIIMGMIPTIRKKSKNWRVYHFIWMYWSVFGLYAALVSEILTRIPQTPFFSMVGLATGTVMLIGYVGFRTNKKKWVKTFG